MNKFIPGNRKHLTFDDRIYLENSLNEGKGSWEIAQYLCQGSFTSPPKSSETVIVTIVFCGYCCNNIGNDESLIYVLSHL